MALFAEQRMRKTKMLTVDFVQRATQAGLLAGPQILPPAACDPKLPLANGNFAALNWASYFREATNACSTDMLHVFPTNAATIFFAICS